MLLSVIFFKQASMKLKQSQPDFTPEPIQVIDKYILVKEYI